jgi:hypothetical protein
LSEGCHEAGILRCLQRDRRSASWRSKGGSDDEANLITLCTGCHDKLQVGAYDHSQRTAAGLAAAKARGVELGSYGKVLAAKQAAAAAERAETLRPILAELAGMSANAITAVLNERGVPTPRGGRWHAMSVIRVQRRLGIA